MTFKETRISKGTQVIGNVWLRLVVGFICVGMMLPVIITVTSSFQYRGEKVTLIPMPISFDQYLYVLTGTDAYWRGYLNTLSYAIAVIPVQTGIALVSGYALGRGRFRIRKALLGLYIILALFPFQTTILPNYLLMRRLGLFDTFWAVCIPLWLSPMPAVILSSFVRRIDETYFDEFRLNSNSRWQLYIQVLGPMCRPGLIVSAVLTLAEITSMIELPMTLRESMYSWPLAVFLGNKAISEYDSQCFAGAVLLMLPILTIYGLCYENILKLLGVLQVSKLK